MGNVFMPQQLYPDPPEFWVTKCPLKAKTHGNVIVFIPAQQDSKLGIVRRFEITGTPIDEDIIVSQSQFRQALPQGFTTLGPQQIRKFASFYLTDDELKRFGL